MSVLINGKLVPRSSLNGVPATSKRRKRKHAVKKILTSGQQTVGEVSRDFARWKKTPDYARWKRRQFLKQGGLCWYCQCYLPSVRENTEHVIARSLGGTNARSNLVLSCADCNREKGAKRLPVETLEKLWKRNGPNRGTYLKNKAHYERLYGDVSNKAIADKLSQL